VNARPGSGPLPGVVTISVSRTLLANTLRVAAPVGLSRQAFASLTRIETRWLIGTSSNVSSNHSAPATRIVTALKLRQLGCTCV
jgi:hypothetical protein